jgi:hypothetical protein
VQTEPARRIRNVDQVGDGKLVVLSSGDEGHAAPPALLGQPTAESVPAITAAR